MSKIVYLVVRRDHSGNLDVVRKEDGVSFAINLSESEAEALIAYVQRDHRKPHGQSYWKLSYERGTLHQFLSREGIRI